MRPLVSPVLRNVTFWSPASEFFTVTPGLPSLSLSTTRGSFASVGNASVGFARFAPDTTIDCGGSNTDPSATSSSEKWAWTAGIAVTNAGGASSVTLPAIDFTGANVTKHVVNVA